MIVVNNENYNCVVYERTENGFDFKDQPYAYFRCRPANNLEKKSYNLMKGVETSNDSVYLISSNLPDDLIVGSKVVFCGSEKIIQSIGYYYDMSRVVNPSLLSDEKIMAKCPKGITLQ